MFLSTKKYSHNLKIKSYFFGWNVQYSEPRRQQLSSFEKTAPRRQEGKSGNIQVCNKESRQSKHQRSGIKVRNSAFYVYGRCRPLGSLNAFLSQAPQLSGANPVSLLTLFLASSQLLSNHGVGMAASAESQFGEPSFTFEGQKSLMAVTFLVY